MKGYSYSCVCMNILVLHVSVCSGGYATPLGDAHILILIVIVIVTVIFLRNVRTVKLLTLIKIDFAQGTQMDDERFVEFRLCRKDD